MIIDDYLNSIRTFELDELLPDLPPLPSNILEVGAGSGWQAHLLSKAGYKVSAIDIHTNPFAPIHSPVMVYDGVTFPFSDGRFDIVYVSNVLDHVRNVHDFSNQIHRVLKPGGIWILVVPTAAWAFWNLVFYYFKLPISIYSKLKRRRISPTTGKAIPLKGTHTRYLFAPHRLGERGNAFSEILLFTKKRRIEFLKSEGWRVERYRSLPLFYTGVRILGARISLAIRQKMSMLMGSGCDVYILTSEKNSSSLK